MIHIIIKLIYVYIIQRLSYINMIHRLLTIRLFKYEHFKYMSYIYVSQDKHHFVTRVVRNSSSSLAEGSDGGA